MAFFEQNVDFDCYGSHSSWRHETKRASERKGHFPSLKARSLSELCLSIVLES